jgi:hypothetical protein
MVRLRSALPFSLRLFAVGHKLVHMKPAEIDVFVIIVWTVVGWWLGLSIAVGYWYRNKGGSFFAGFILAVLTSPLFGIIIVAISKTNTDSLERRALSSGKMKKCPFCAELIKREAKVCRFCNRDLRSVQLPKY